MMSQKHVCTHHSWDGALGGRSEIDLVSNQTYHYRHAFNAFVRECGVRTEDKMSEPTPLPVTPWRSVNQYNNALHQKFVEESIAHTSYPVRHSIE